MSALAAIVFSFALAAASTDAKPPAPRPTSPAEQQVAAEVATRFLDLIDGGQVGSTWDMTGSHIRRLTSRPIWAATLSGIRANVGAIQSRSFVEASFTRAPAASPPGHYYIVRFDSRFERMAVEEKVVLNLEQDRWRVEGYSVMPRKRKAR